MKTTKKKRKIIITIVVIIGSLLGSVIEKKNPEIGKFIKDVFNVVSMVNVDPINNDSINIIN